MAIPQDGGVGTGAAVVGAAAQVAESLFSFGETMAGAVDSTVRLTGAFFNAQRAFVSMATGFDVGLTPMLEVMAESIGAVHEQTRQTQSMGVARQALFDSLKESLDGLPGSIDEKFNIAISFLQFGLRENMGASVELANRLRLQGHDGAKLVKQFNMVGRSLMMTQESIDELMEATIEGSKAQTITTAALLRFTEESTKGLSDPAMLGMAPALSKIAVAAGERFGEQSMPAFKGILEQLSRFDDQSIIGKNRLGIGIGFMDKLASADGQTGLNMLITKMGDAGIQFGVFTKTGLEYEFAMKNLVASMGGDTGLAKAVLEFNNAVALGNKEQFGAAALGGKDDNTDIAEGLFAQQEEIMNSLRVTSHKIGEMQEQNALEIGRSLGGMVTSFDTLVNDGLAPILDPDFKKSGENLVAFTEGLSTQFTSLQERLSFLIKTIGPDETSGLKTLFGGILKLNNLITGPDGLIGGLSSWIGRTLVKSDVLSPPMASKIAAGLEILAKEDVANFTREDMLEFIQVIKEVAHSTNAMSMLPEIWEEFQGLQAANEATVTLANTDALAKAIAQAIKNSEERLRPASRQ